MHPERSRNVSRCGMKLIIPHNGHITNENRADRRAQMKIELTGVRGTLLVISSAAIAAFRMLFPAAMHPEIAFGRLADTGSCFRLPCIFNLLLRPWRILLYSQSIPGGGFFRMWMILSGENNPWKKILPNGDEFTLEKIISGGGFFRMEMISL